MAFRVQLQHIPSTGDLPIVSEARFLSNTLAFAQRVYARCGPVSRGWWMFKPSVYLMSAEANEMVLFDREARFSARLGWQRVLGELFPLAEFSDKSSDGGLGIHFAYS